MTSITQTAKHIKDQYRKYQLIALACALLTVGAAILAAVSGLQVSRLRNAQAQAVDEAASKSEEVRKVWMEKEIESLRSILTKTQADLAKEKEAVALQQETIDSLKRQLTALSAKARALEETTAKPSAPADATVPKTIAPPTGGQPAPPAGTPPVPAPQPPAPAEERQPPPTPQGTASETVAPQSPSPAAPPDQAAPGAGTTPIVPSKDSPPEQNVDQTVTVPAAPAGEAGSNTLPEATRNPSAQQQ